MRTLGALATVTATLCAALPGSGSVEAQGADSATVAPRAFPAALSVSHDVARFGRTELVGLLGTRYLVSFVEGWAFGPGVYGGITGSRGGFFAIGGEVAGRRSVAREVSIVGALFGGGSGGGSARVGSGLFLRLYAGVRWHLDAVEVDVGASHIDIGHSVVSSTQASLGLSVPLTFRVVPRDRLGVPVGATGRSGIGFDDVESFVMSYHPIGASTRISGGALAAFISLVGVRAERALTLNAGIALEGLGAASGGAAGYAEYLVSGWWRTALWHDRASVGLRVGAGMGGGGDVPVAGGLLLKGAGTGRLRLTDALELRVEGGFVRAPGERFEALTASAGLAFAVDGAATDSQAAYPVRTEWLIGMEAHDAVRIDGSRGAIANVALRANRFVTPLFYVSGQTRYSLYGGVGGYGAGLVGAGVESPIATWRCGAELLVGAAGGGGLSVGGGAIVQGLAYIVREIGAGFAVRGGVGGVRSLEGTVSATVADLSLGYLFGVTRGRRARS